MTSTDEGGIENNTCLKHLLLYDWICQILNCLGHAKQLHDYLVYIIALVMSIIFYYMMLIR